MSEFRPDRLLKVAIALRESPNPDRFTMRMWGHGCNTPACAMGHYAARADLQDAFMLTDRGQLTLSGPAHAALRAQGLHAEMERDYLDHFGISGDEWGELFGWSGCSDAKTANEAADYIVDFVKRKCAALKAAAK